jgi:hypothetical protein
MKKRIVCILLILSLSAPTGCGYLIAAGAGGAGGYILRDQGYEIKSPVEKTEKKADEE